MGWEDVLLKSVFIVATVVITPFVVWLIRKIEKKYAIDIDDATEKAFKDAAFMIVRFLEERFVGDKELEGVKMLTSAFPAKTETQAKVALNAAVNALSLGKTGKKEAASLSALTAPEPGRKLQK